MITKSKDGIHVRGLYSSKSKIYNKKYVKGWIGIV